MLKHERGLLKTEAHTLCTLQMLSIKNPIITTRSSFVSSGLLRTSALTERNNQSS